MNRREDEGSPHLTPRAGLIVVALGGIVIAEAYACSRYVMSRVDAPNDLAALRMESWETESNALDRSMLANVTGSLSVCALRKMACKTAVASKHPSRCKEAYCRPGDRGKESIFPPISCADSVQ